MPTITQVLPRNFIIASIEPALSKIRFKERQLEPRTHERASRPTVASASVFYPPVCDDASGRRKNFSVR
jgi:hypothetical protein